MVGEWLYKLVAWLTEWTNSSLSYWEKNLYVPHGIPPAFSDSWEGGLFIVEVQDFSGLKFHKVVLGSWQQSAVNAVLGFGELGGHV